MGSKSNSLGLQIRSFRSSNSLPTHWLACGELNSQSNFRPRYLSTSRPHNTVPNSLKSSRIENSSLVITDKLRRFRARPDFGRLITERGQAYFDRTRYISVLSEFEPPILFFRPRRFGKSLTVNMLEHFHDVQCKNVHQSSYKGLDVQNDIMEGIVTPGQFLILKFDFSSVYRGPNMDLAAQSLREYMELVFEEFYNKYATYLDGNHSHRITRSNPGNSMGDCVALVNRVLSNAKRSTGKPLADIRGIYLLVDEYDAFSNHFLAPHNTFWQGSDIEGTFKHFWSTVKALQNEIPGMFITGVSPLSLTDITSGFNIAENISFHERVAGLCGLTLTDIKAGLKEACGASDAYEKHLSIMARFFNGYHFCQKPVESVYNPETCLSYLQSVIEGQYPQVQDPENSEVSDDFLKTFSSSPSAIRDFEEVLKRDERGELAPLRYERLKRNFKLADLRQDVEKSKPAWRSLMLYHGGLTFCPEDPAHYLKVPNEVAAERIGEAVLNKYGLRESLTAALHDLKSSGDIKPILSCYRDLMIQRDVGYSDYGHSERIHRDSFYYSLLQNASLLPQAEFRLTMPSNKPGRADFVLPLGSHLIVTEWKVVQIDYLDIKSGRRSKGASAGLTPGSRDSKASILSQYTLEQILKLKFSKKDQYRPGKNLRQWIKNESLRLKDYISSAEVKKKLKEGGLVLKAHMIVVIGSRHILLWEMNNDGELADKPELVGV